MSGAPGFRQNKGPSTKDRVKALEVTLKNTQQALQISQMMIKQLMQQIDMLRNDTSNSINTMNDLQYRTLAMINIGSVDVDALDAEADRLKLEDYNKASDKEDIEKNYTVSDEVGENSVVIITSTTDTEEDQGIFRSKIPVVQIPFEKMRQDIVGLKVGDKFDADINGINHHIEIIGVREFPKKLEIVNNEETSVVTEVESCNCACHPEECTTACACSCDDDSACNKCCDDDNTAKNE